MIAILGLLLVGFLVGGILYPDDPDDRAARVKRAIVTMISLSVAVALADFLIGHIVFGADAGAFNPTFILAALQLSAVPISIAERVAGLLKPRRSPFWAFFGLATCLAWSALLLWILMRGVGVPLPPAVAIVDIALPGIVAGLVWHALLPRRDVNVGGIFE